MLTILRMDVFFLLENFQCIFKDTIYVFTYISMYMCHTFPVRNKQIMKLSFAFYLYAPVHRRYQHLAGCSFATRTLFCNALKCKYTHTSTYLYT